MTHRSVEQIAWKIRWRAFNWAETTVDYSRRHKTTRALRKCNCRSWMFFTEYEIV